MEPIDVLAFCGSLRAGSYNHRALKAAQELTPDGMNIQIYDHLGEIPPFNQDFEREMPEVVQDLKRRVYGADAILFGMPEYNYGVPGVLKNAIDWASRPYGDNSWCGKPVAIMSASMSLLGGVRAHYQLRQSFVFLNMLPVNQPEVLIASAHERFDENGRLTDQMSRDLISQLLSNLQSWTQKVGPNRMALRSAA